MILTSVMYVAWITAQIDFVILVRSETLMKFFVGDIKSEIVTIIYIIWHQNHWHIEYSYQKLWMI